METIESVSTELMNLVRMLGPESKNPPYVRLAFPPLALPRVLRQFCGEAEREQRELLEEVHAHGGVITPREMGRMHRRWMDPVAAEMALRRLCSAGAGYLARTHRRTPEPQVPPWSTPAGRSPNPRELSDYGCSVSADPAKPEQARYSG